MPQLFAISVMRWNVEAPPTLLFMDFELSSFSFFKRPTIKELVTFFCRQVVQRTKPGEKNVVDQGDYVCHCFVSGDRLASAIITDKDYPTRVGLSLAALVMREFNNQHSDNWQGQTHDVQLDTPALHTLLEKYQKPDEADNILKIQKELDDVKEILHKSMEDLLTRGDKLENIIEKSEDLSASSKQFLWQAKKTNSCCGY
ncbi:palmitoyltransferase [Balamuthia mandrillaris]